MSSSKINPFNEAENVHIEDGGQAPDYFSPTKQDLNQQEPVITEDEHHHRSSDDLGIAKIKHDVGGGSKVLLLSDSCLAGTAPESAIDDSDMPDILPPDNALHLHVPSDHVKDIVVPLPDGKEFERRGSITLATSDSVSCSRPGTFRVRFRSRVRIASARRTSHTASIDSSPSSSISAPLRYTPDDVDYDNLQHYATYAYPHRPQFQRPSRASLRSNPPSVGPPSVNDISASEQTPLLRAPGSRLGVRTRKRYGLADEDDEDEETSTERQAARKAQEEKAFGKWPYRLLNGYWWIWKCEPVLCCCCPADDSDSEADE